MAHDVDAMAAGDASELSFAAAWQRLSSTACDYPAVSLAAAASVHQHQHTPSFSLSLSLFSQFLFHS